MLVRCPMQASRRAAAVEWRQALEDQIEARAWQREMDRRSEVMSDFTTARVGGWVGGLGGWEGERVLACVLCVRAQRGLTSRLFKRLHGLLYVL